MINLNEILSEWLNKVSKQHRNVDKILAENLSVRCCCWRAWQNKNCPPPGEVCNFVATNPTKPLKTLSAALWTYFNADKFETGLLAVIHEGGDADTYTSLTGSLLGAKCGFNAIPVNHLMV